MLHRIPQLMDTGRPVAVLFTEKEAERSGLLYCELIQKARFGESFLIKGQGCSVGAFVLGEIEKSPEDYYFASGRYRNISTAKRAVSALPRLSKRVSSIHIAPYSGEKFDIIILFLEPGRAMRLVQAYTYSRGDPFVFSTGGIASVCSDCTAYPVHGKMGISTGCKGSRKHTMYGDDELVVGIPFELAMEIDDVLGKIPETLE